MKRKFSCSSFKYFLRVIEAFLLFFFFLIETCFKDRDYEHGDEHITGCNNCTCNDGNFLCGSIACPTLSCPPEEQISVANECCKYCKGNGNLVTL